MNTRSAAFRTAPQPSIAGLAALAAALLALGCGDESEPAEAPTAPPPRQANVDDARLRAGDTEAGSWLSTGRTYAEERFSPLAQIDATNVAGLQRRWSFDTGTDRGLEATPLVVDGVMYTTGTWSVVYALDAVTGELLWKYDPQVPREVGKRACCDVVNRGVAVYTTASVFVGALDGRLIALDSRHRRRRCGRR